MWALRPLPSRDRRDAVQMDQALHVVEVGDLRIPLCDRPGIIRLGSEGSYLLALTADFSGLCWLIRCFSPPPISCGRTFPVEPAPSLHARFEQRLLKIVGLPIVFVLQLDGSINVLLES